MTQPPNSAAHVRTNIVTFEAMPNAAPPLPLKAHTLALNAISACVSVVDTDSTILLVNDAWVSYTGMAREDVIGRRVSDLPDFNNISARQIAFEECLREGKSTCVSGPYRMIDGQIRIVETHCHPYRDEDGSIQGVVRVSHDITSQTLAQAALERATQEAWTANQAKSRFLSKVSHELRTPLSAVIGFADLLAQEGTNASEASRTYANNILAAGQQLKMLIDDLLDHSQLEERRLRVTVENIAVEPVVKHVFATLHPMAQTRGVALHLVQTAHPDDVLLKADPKRLNQVLTNLVSNAIKYNREGGDVRVSCAPTGDGNVAVTVQDNGLGIPEDALDKIFEPFERLHHASGKVEGVGLGLSICKELVNLMDGDLSVRSVEGQGSVFTVTLRAANGLASAQPRPLATTPLPAPAISSAKLKLLYVEDQALNQLLMQHSLNGLGQTDLTVVNSAEQGWAMLQQQRFDAVLLDVQLPGMSGSDLLRLIRGTPEFQGLCVVAVTGLEETAPELTGFDLVLPKPWTTTWLQQALDFVCTCLHRAPLPHSESAGHPGP
jgi:PAS domain S-box-containing protein